VSGARVLLVDDDPAILRAVGRALRSSGFAVETLDRGERLASSVTAFGPDVILLDLVLPDADGIELTRQVSRGRASVIVLSAVGEDRKKVEALDAGADDYLTKPFSLDELQARIRVALRHQARSTSEPALIAGPLRMDLVSHEAEIGGKPIHLTPREFELLRFMAEEQGRLLTGRMLLARVWGPGYVNDAHILRTFIYQLRSKLERAHPGAGALIVTDPGVGYRFAARDS
jgi:two-component system KDP operon response regulator KdpE